MAVPLPCAASQQGSTCSSSISTLRSSTSLEVEHQHVVPAALTLVPPVLRLQGGGPVEEDRDAHAHDAVDGGAAHEGVATRLQAAVAALEAAAAVHQPAPHRRDKKKRRGRRPRQKRRGKGRLGGAMACVFLHTGEGDLPIVRRWRTRIGNYWR